MNFKWRFIRKRRQCAPISRIPWKIGFSLEKSVGGENSHYLGVLSQLRVQERVSMIEVCISLYEYIEIV